MLRDEERREIEEEMERYPTRRAVGLEALRIVQRHRGWVSDEALQDVAALLDMAPAELDGVATFYNLLFRKPVGRNVIFVCDSVSCWLLGSDRIRRHLEERLGIRPGETTADGKFTLLPIVCLGDCDHAPSMLVGSDLHHDLDPERVDAVLEEYR